MKLRQSRIIALFIALVVMFSTTTVYAESGITTRAARTITKDTVYSGTLTAGSTDTYYFTPSYSGMFTVETFGSTDTYGTVSGNTGTIFPTASNDDGGEGANFAIGFSQEAGSTTTITVRHYNSTSGTGSYTIQVRDQRAQIYTFDYGSGDINTHDDATTPRSWLTAMGYSVGVHQNKPASHVDETIASTFKRLNSEVVFFSGHGSAGHLTFINSSGGYNRLYDYSPYFTSMANTKVAVWSSCKSAVDPDGTDTRRSIAQKSIDIGAQAAIGWTEVTDVPAAKKWTDQFFLELGNAMTVQAAAASAGSVFLWPWDGNYDGWQVFGDGSTLVSYPNINPKSSTTPPIQMVDDALLQKLSNTEEYTPYELKGLGTRYYKTINGHLTNEFYDIHDSGIVKTSSVVFSDADILNISQQKLATSIFSPVMSTTAYGVTFNKLTKVEEHIVYMKINDNIVPIKLIYSNYQNDGGLEYQEVVCINLLDKSFIDYADICTL